MSETKIEIGGEELQHTILTKGAIPGVHIGIDWYGNTPSLQVLIYDNENDDPAAAIRYSPEGLIDEVMLRDDLQGKVVTDDAVTEWISRRDGKES